MTDFRARGTIIGPTGLTAVFGMGTGVTPPVSSPEMSPAGGQAAPGAVPVNSDDRSRSRTTEPMQWLSGRWSFIARPAGPHGRAGRLVERSGDDRLSRQGHYHGPGGLNGRVRDGNGCGPAGMVAGKEAGGDLSPAGLVARTRRLSTGGVCED